MSAASRGPRVRHSGRSRLWRAHVSVGEAPAQTLLSALVAVLGRQIGADERLESRPIRGLGVEGLALGAQLVSEDVRDEILLGREVGVEGAVRQAGVGHESRYAGAVDAVLLEASSGRF